VFVGNESGRREDFVCRLSVVEITSNFINIYKKQTNILVKDRMGKRISLNL